MIHTCFGVHRRFPSFLAPSPNSGDDFIERLPLSYHHHKPVLSFSAFGT
jgi:hypothetical protein